jgi:hypothetical protein
LMRRMAAEFIRVDMAPPVFPYSDRVAARRGREIAAIPLDEVRAPSVPSY